MSDGAVSFENEYLWPEQDLNYPRNIAVRDKMHACQMFELIHETLACMSQQLE